MCTFLKCRSFSMGKNIDIKFLLKTFIFRFQFQQVIFLYSSSTIKSNRLCHLALAIITLTNSNPQIASNNQISSNPPTANTPDSTRKQATPSSKTPFNKSWVQYGTRKQRLLRSDPKSELVALSRFGSAVDAPGEFNSWQFLASYIYLHYMHLYAS